MKGLIRLDISSSIGTGHFQRMVNLADAMPDIDFTFLVKTDNPESKIFKNFKVCFIRGDDLPAVASIAKDFHFIIYDLLHYRKNYIQQAKKLTDKLTITFHEYDDYSMASDLTINYNFFKGFEEKESASFLAGPRYIIFNDTVLNTCSGKEQGVFVSFGGADPSGYTIKFIKEIANNLTQIPFHVHTGPFFSHRDRLDNLRIADNVVLHDQPHNLYELMSQARLAVTAGGNMLYELMYLKKWSFVLAHNTHQKEFAYIAARHKACEYVGDKQNINWTILRKKLEKEYMIPSRKPSCQIDGQGKYRIAKKINNLLN